jgi:predicted Zn finger-like uncharacterized protein
MILECPSCHARYMVPNGLFAAGTRQVRCARCKHEWQAKTPNNIDVVLPPAPVVVAPPPPPPKAEAPPPPPKVEEASRPPPPVPPKLEKSPPPMKKPDAAKPAPEKKPEEKPAASEAPAQHAAEDTTPKFITNLPVIIKKINWKKNAAKAAAGFAIIFVLLAWPVLDREPIVKAFPSLRGFYESFGLSIPKTGAGLIFDKVSSELRYDSGTMKLFVDGVIHNSTSETQFIPDIKAAARGADQSVIQSWWVDAPAVTIPGGGEVPFHTEIGATTQRTIEDVYLEFTARDEKHDAAQ